MELILINDRELDGTSRQIAMQTAIIDEDASLPIGRSVERNLDLDPPLRPKDLNPLIRYALGRDRERQLPPGTEVHQRAGGSINAEGRVLVDERDDPQGLGIEEITACDDRIAADVEEPSPANIRPVADIGGIDIEL